MTRFLVQLTHTPFGEKESSSHDLFWSVRHLKDLSQEMGGLIENSPSFEGTVHSVLQIAKTLVLMGINDMSSKAIIGEDYDGYPTFLFIPTDGEVTISVTLMEEGDDDDEASLGN